jgi:hypothetical protein
MKRGGGDGGGGGIGNGSLGVTMSLSPSSSSISNNDNKMMIQLPDSPSSALGSLSLQERDHEQQQCAAASTTFVHVDTCNFREVVQKLTGASDNDGLEKFPITLPSRQAARAAAAAAGGGDKLADNTYGGLIPKPVGDLSARRPAFKLHERRQSFLLRKLDVKGLGLPSGLRRGTSGGYGSSAAAAAVCSPTSDLSPRFNPSLMSSPVTPLTMNVFENNNAGSNGNGCAPTTPNSYDVYTCLRPRETQAQELLEGGAGGEVGGGGSPAAAAGSREERFFLHSSPTLERPRQLPELLTLFPLTSPRASEPS